MAGILGNAGTIIGSVGLFFGFYFLYSSPPKYGLEIVTMATVGMAGLLAFVRHVIYYKSDMKRLGWETERPDWMFEVGFANLAFGFMGLVAVLAKWGTLPQALTVFGYALYLFQAGLLHGYRYFTDEQKSPQRLWRSCILTLLYAGMMTFIAVGVLQR